MKSFKKSYLFDIAIIIACIVFTILSKLTYVICLLALLVIVNIFRKRGNSIIGQINTALYNNDYDTAIKLMKQISTDPKTDSNTLGSYVFTCLKYGDVDSIMNDIDSLLEQHPDYTQQDKDHVLLYKSVGYWLQNNLDEALKLSEEIFERDKRPFAYEVYGFFLIQSGNLDRALDVNVEGSYLKNTTNVIKTNLGETYYKLGQRKKSAQIFTEQVTKKKVKYIEPHYYLGVLLAEQGNTKEAISTLESALFCPKSLMTSVNKDMVRKAILDIDPEFKFDDDEL